MLNQVNKMDLGQLLNADVGFVQKIKGIVVAKNQQRGDMRFLQMGDAVFPNDLVYVSGEGSATIVTKTGEEVVVTVDAPKTWLLNTVEKEKEAQSEGSSMC